MLLFISNFCSSVLFTLFAWCYSEKIFPTKSRSRNTKGQKTLFTIFGNNVFYASSIYTNQKGN